MILTLSRQLLFIIFSYISVYCRLLILTRKLQNEGGAAQSTPTTLFLISAGDFVEIVTLQDIFCACFSPELSFLLLCTDTTQEKSYLIVSEPSVSVLVK